MAEIDLGNVQGEINPDTVIEYTVPDTYTAPASGDMVKTIFGKITRGLADLFSGKIDKTQIINNLAATITGNVLDATQGKVLDDKIGVINTNLTNMRKNIFIGNSTIPANSTGLTITSSFSFSNCNALEIATDLGIYKIPITGGSAIMASIYNFTMAYLENYNLAIAVSGNAITVTCPRTWSSGTDYISRTVTRIDAIKY